MFWRFRYCGVTVSAAAEVRFDGRRDCQRAAYFAELSPVVYGLRRKHSISPANMFRFRIADLKSFMASAVVGLRRNRLDYTAN
jgi:hypothetical protein